MSRPNIVYAYLLLMSSIVDPICTLNCKVVDRGRLVMVGGIKGDVLDRPDTRHMIILATNPCDVIVLLLWHRSG